jgi:hypothetical protein
MEKMLLVSNWIIFGLLFASFFLKLTDKKERDSDRKIIYGLLMLYTLFISVILFKNTFNFGENVVQINIGFYQTFFNLLILFFMATKIRYDKLFKK